MMHQSPEAPEGGMSRRAVPVYDHKNPAAAKGPPAAESLDHI